MKAIGRLNQDLNLLVEKKDFSTAVQSRLRKESHETL